MIDELRHAVEHAQQQLSETAQRDLAARIEEWLDEQEWDAISGRPKGQATLSRLISEADTEIARGDIKEGGWE